MRIQVWYSANRLFEVCLWATLLTFCHELTFAGEKAHIQTEIIIDTMTSKALFLPEVQIESSVSKSSYRKSTGSFSVANTAQISQKSALGWSEQFNSLAGVYMQQGSLSTSRITIRGIGSRTPYGTNRLKMYWNNIPISSLDGSTNLELLSTNDVSKIEVRKGPSAVNYGSGLGGIISLYTAPQKTASNFSAEIGSFNSRNSNLHVKLIDSVNYVTFKVSKTLSHGYRQHNRFERLGFDISAGHNVGDHAVSVHLLVNGLTADIPSSLSLSQLATNRFMAASNWLSAEGYEKAQSALAGISWKYNTNRFIRNEATLFFKNFSGFERRPFNTLDDKLEAIGVRNMTSMRWRSLSFFITTELQNEKYNWRILESNLNDDGALLYKNKDTKNSLNIGLLASWTLQQRLTVEGGINYNTHNYRLDKADDTEGLYHFSPIFSPSLGVNYTASSQHNIFGSISSGFSYPSLEETLLPQGDFNKNLKPETGIIYETGWRFSTLNKIWFNEVSLYAMDLTNLLVTKRESETVFYQINAGQTRLMGIEIAGEIELLKPIKNRSIILTYALWGSQNKFIRFIDDNTSFNNKKIPGIPAYSASLSLNMWPLKHLSLLSSLFIAGQQYITDSNLAQTNAYAVAQFRLGYKVDVAGIRCAPYIGVNNAFNTHYTSMIVPNAASFNNQQPRYYYPGAPRYTYIGINIHLRN